MSLPGLPSWIGSRTREPRWPISKALVQAALEAEMTEAIGAAKGERSETRLSYRSGYYRRSLITRVGTLELRVPQDRMGRFSTELFERYQSSGKASTFLQNLTHTTGRGAQGYPRSLRCSAACSLNERSRRASGIGAQLV